jgi:carboxylesterase
VARPAHIDPGAFSFEGDDTGVLLIHGLTGAPPEMRPLGEALRARGHTVVAPLLPGHGTRVEELRGVPYTAWVDHAARALDELRGRTSRVVIGALSMGTLVAAHLAASGGVDALFVMAPALKVNMPAPIWTTAGLKRVWHIANKPPSADTHLDDEVWCYDQIPIAALHELWRLQRAAVKRLPEVRAPALVMGGRLDDAVPASAVERYFSLLGSDDKELVWWDKTGHVVPLDRERDAVFARVCAFLDHAASGTTSTRASGLST